MKYIPLNQKVIVKVKKFNKEEIKQKKKYVEGSSLIEMPDLEVAEDVALRETTSQTKGEIIAFGPLVNKFADGTDTGAKGQFEIGDIVHFQRYGAYRLDPEIKEAEFEFWAVLDKDLLVKEMREVEEVING